jgi:hypothetical protein
MSSVHGGTTKRVKKRHLKPPTIHGLMFSEPYYSSPLGARVVVVVVIDVPLLQHRTAAA